MSKEKVRKFSVNDYLKESKHNDKIKKMMVDMFKGKAKTLEEWKEVDENVNGRRC